MKRRSRDAFSDAVCTITAYGVPSRSVEAVVDAAQVLAESKLKKDTAFVKRRIDNVCAGMFRTMAVELQDPIDIIELEFLCGGRCCANTWRYVPMSFGCSANACA